MLGLRLRWDGVCWVHVWAVVVVPGAALRGTVRYGTWEVLPIGA